MLHDQRLTNKAFILQCLAVGFVWFVFFFLIKTFKREKSLQAKNHKLPTFENSYADKWHRRDITQNTDFSTVQIKISEIMFHTKYF